MRNLFLFLVGAFFTLSSCKKLTFSAADIQVVENCVPIGKLAVIKLNDTTWALQNNQQDWHYFPNEVEAEKSKQLLLEYGASSHCNCGNTSFTKKNGKPVSSGAFFYQRTADGQGIGNSELNTYPNPVEDCLPFDPEKLVARKDLLNGEWYLIEGRFRSMFSFGKEEEACKNALKVIKKYGYNQSCFVGRPMASFAYLKKYRTDFNPIQQDNLDSLNSTK
jgi:hypothetical protein